MSLAERLMKKTKLSGASVMATSKFFETKAGITTDVPVINLALSGWLNGGFDNELVCLAGPSKHFKSALGLIMCEAFQRKHQDGLIVFYDSEFGASKEYFNAAGVDLDRVLHIPIRNIEELKFDIMNKLDEITSSDKVMFFIDSIGNLASKKEVDDALNEKSVADMTRAKQLKSLFRMVTPYLKTVGIPMVAINHTYEDMGMFPKTIVSGGSGVMYSASSVMVIGKRQVKNEGESQILGWEFVLNIEKSRCIREKSAIPFTVTYEGGIEKYSGLLDIAKTAGFVTMESKGWYSRPSIENDRKWRRKETMSEEFWAPLLEDPAFHDAIHNMYKLGSSSQMADQLKEELIESSVDESGELE